MPAYQAPVAIPSEASSSQSPTKTANHRKARIIKETQKVEVETKVMRNGKPAGGPLIQKPPCRKSDKLKGLKENLAPQVPKVNKKKRKE